MGDCQVNGQAIIMKEGLLIWQPVHPNIDDRKAGTAALYPQILISFLICLELKIQA